jgi:serine/threonine protein kinase
LSGLVVTHLHSACLSRGSFGNVYKAVHKKSHKEVAIKIMDRGKIKPTSIHREWNVLEHLGHHPYIVDYIGTYKTRDHVYFCMECMYGGELFDRLIRRGAYAEVEVRTPFRNLAHALAYLHSQGIVHRDLKVRGKKRRKGAAAAVRRGEPSLCERRMTRPSTSVCPTSACSLRTSCSRTRPSSRA